VLFLKAFVTFNAMLCYPFSPFCFCYALLSIFEIGSVRVHFQARSQNFEKRLLASSCMTVRPHITALLPRTDFNATRYLSFLRKSVEKTQALLKSDKNSGNFIGRRFHIYDNIALYSS
jgi:hypothetical protein